MNMWWLGLLGLLGAVRHFVLRRRRAAAMMVAGGLSVLPVTPAAAAETCGAEGYDIKRCWYLGAGVGAAHLNPEGRVNGWGTDSAGSLGIEVHLGQYITPKWFWELRYTDAGEAELGNVNSALDEAISDAAISYKIPSIMAGYVVWSGAVDVYMKAGMSFIETQSTDSRIGQDEQSSTQLAMGAGVQYRLPELPWQVHLSLESYDRDARMFTLGVSRHFD